MTTVAESMTWASHAAPLKAYLGVEGDAEDARLEAWLAGAAAAADQFIGTEVTDEEREELEAWPYWRDGSRRYDPTAPWGSKSLYAGELPGPVATGCYEWVKAARAVYSRTFGLTGVKTGDLSEQYAVGSRVSGGDAGPADFTRAVAGWWWPYKRFVCL